MKVTFAIPYFYPALQYGGQPRSAYELARALVSRGHQVKVLTTDSAGTQRLEPSVIGPDGRKTIEGVEVIYYRNVSNQLAYQHRIFWPPRMFREMDRELRGGDIVHIHELRSTVSVLAYSAARRLGIPFVLSAHGGLRHIGRAKLKTAYDTLWGRRILRDATAVLAISPLEERDASSMLVEGSRVRRLPNAIDLSAFAAMPELGNFRTRNQLRGKNIVLFLGRLHWVKGGDLLLDAFSRIAASYPNAQLVFAGPDDGQEKELRGQASRLKMTGRVTFTGYLEHGQKLEAFVDASVVVIPSRSEVFAITAVEALMCARPVLMSSACGLFPSPQPEHGVTVFESENAGDLAAKLSTMLAGSGFGHGGAQGQAFAAREFSAERIGKQAEDIYSDVLQCSRRVS